MTIAWHSVPDFTQRLLDHLKKAEGNHYEARDVGDGKVTIGSGFNISETTVREKVYARFFITAPQDIDSLATSAARTAERAYRTELDNAINSHNIAALDGIMARRAADPRLAGVISNLRTDFRFHSDQEVKDTLIALLPSYDQRLTNWLPSLGTDSDFKTSQEHIALLSLSFNSKTGPTDLLGPGLKSAIVNGNRAEAWYQIRYKSANNGTQGLGIVVRRFAESELFGLYNPGVTSANIADADAKDVYRMFNKHRKDIEAYEKKFGVWDSKTGSQRDASGRLPLFAANQDYGLTGDATVDTITEALQPARTYLLTEYVTNKGINTAIDGDILVGYDPFSAGTTTAGQDDIPGSAKNDLIFGEGGNDIIDGKEGDDVIYGGTGDDTLKGDAGNDAYVYQSGDGRDIIDDSDGKGSLVIAVDPSAASGAALSGSSQTAYRLNYVDTWDGAGGLRYTLLNGDLKNGGTLRVSGGMIGDGQIDIQHFKNGDLGITLNSEYDLAWLNDGEATPFTHGGAEPQPSSGGIGERGSRQFRVVLNRAARAGDKIVLKASGGDGQVFSGAENDAEWERAA